MSLKREELIKIVDDFYSKRSEYSANNDLMSLYLQTLNNLSKVLLSHEFEEDKRFVTYGRRDFLKQELETSLESEDYNQAFYDIIDYVKADTWIPLSSVPTEYNFQDTVNMDNEYKNSGIISKQEQDILLAMIKDFKNIVEKNKNNKFTNYEGEMLIGDSQCDLCKHKNDDNYGCTKFGKAPQEVLKNEFKCKEFKSKTASYPWNEE